MKTKKIVYGFACFAVVVVSFMTMSFNCYRPIQNSHTLQDSSIVGTWISNKDNKWKLVFTSNSKCYQYYDSVLSETDTVLISNTSPQCGVNVTIDANTNYLQLTNIQDNTDKICYLINGISDTSLSLSVLDSGSPMVFTKL